MDAPSALMTSKRVLNTPDNLQKVVRIQDSKEHLQSTESQRIQGEPCSKKNKSAFFKKYKLSTMVDTEHNEDDHSHSEDGDPEGTYDYLQRKPKRTGKNLLLQYKSDEFG